VEIGSLVEKLLLGVLFHKNLPGRSPRVKLGTFLIIQHFSSRQPESIGMFIVKIVRTVKKLIQGGVFTKIPCSLP
jgi:hypothetical protein